MLNSEQEAMVTVMNSLVFGKSEWSLNPNVCNKIADALYKEGFRLGKVVDLNEEEK